MPVRVSCPHCRTPCLVAEQHLGKPVQCGRCSRTFTTRGEAAPATAAAPATTAILAPPEPPLRLDVGAATSTGRVRDRNEDSFLVQHLVCSNLDDRRDVAVLVVADGMGGAAAGDRASGLVVRTVGAALTPLLVDVLGGKGIAGAAEAVAAALREANRAVWSAAQAAELKGMGATAAAVVVCGSQVQIGHVGDCRVYHARGGQLTQVTRDQTLVARMVELGQLTPRQAETHRARNEVTNAVGMAPKMEPAAYQLRLVSGDWLLVACDGLHAHLDNKMVQEEIARSVPSAAALAQRLVERADQLGGTDNCTVVALRCY